MQHVKKYIELINKIEKSYLIKLIIYGNYFYGLCAVALSIEASLQQSFTLNDTRFYLTLFSLTVLYYSRAYLQEAKNESINNRTEWYIKNIKFVITSQILLTLLCIYSAFIFTTKNLHFLLQLNPFEYLIILIFPIVALLYYGIDSRKFPKFNLRKIGWLKPFIIGFSWAGMISVYPILYFNIEHSSHYTPNLIAGLLFLKNFMFVSLLCIMFDIKDYARDYNQQLKTFVVQNGLRRTIFLILIPMSTIGLGTFVIFGIYNHFQVLRIIFNMIPFLLLIFVSYSLHKRKSILYYLIIIDGLMLIKAICGSIAMIYFS